MVHSEAHPEFRYFPRLLVFLLIAIVVLVIGYLLIFRPTDNENTISSSAQSDVTILEESPPPLNMDELNIVFRDNFQIRDDHWAISSPETGYYTRGALVLHDTQRDGFAWARPRLRFQDFVLNVDAKWLSGAIGGDFGVRVRYTDKQAESAFNIDNESLSSIGLRQRSSLEGNSFIEFIIGNDGWYTIGRLQEGKGKILHEAFSNHIYRDGRTNALQVEVTGDDFRFFVNGMYLADLHYAGTTFGDIMLTAFKPDETESFEVAFDNLVVGMYPTP